MNMNIDIDATELQRRVEEVLRDFPEAGKKCIENACLIIESKAKQNAPVDFGTLRSSITHKPVQNNNTIEGYVYTNEEYAPHVEFGTGIYADNGTGRKSPWVYKSNNGKFYKTVGQEPKKFLSNALVSERDKVAKEFRRFLDYV